MMDDQTDSSSPDHHKNPDQAPTPENHQTRRSALAIILGGAGSIGLGMFGMVAGFVTNALGRKTERPWLRVGAAEELDPESFKAHVLRMQHTHAWIEEQSSLTVFIKDLYPEPPLVLLSTCSHLGCSVKWNPESGDHGQFKCPCHGGVYDAKGQVVSGPPPQPLTQLEVKIEDDTCFVRLPDPSTREKTA